MKTVYRILILTFILMSCTKMSPLYTLNTTIGPEGGGTVHTVINNKSAILQAIPAEHYHFKEWAGSVSGNKNPLIVFVNSNLNIKAVFAKNSYPFSITVTGEGTVTEELLALKSNSYEHGVKCRLTPVPNDGWEFAEWGGDLTGTDNPAEIFINDSTNITCTFRKKSYPLHITIEGEGSVREEIIALKSTSYEHGTSVKLTPIPNTGWIFKEWKNELSGNANPAAVNVVEETNITCIFKKDSDGDEVIDELDHCDNTPLGETVDENGCGESQKDDDVDGVMNNVDLCPDTPDETADDCGCSISQKTYVPDDIFEQFLIDMGLDQVLDNYVITVNIQNLTNFIIPFRNVSDFTGIEDFVALQRFHCPGNQITSIDISKNINLEEFICSFNTNLTHLNVSQNTKLTYLDFGYCKISSIDVSNNNSLIHLSLGWNQVSSLDVSNLSDLEFLHFSANNVSSIDLSHNPDLEYLYCVENQLSSLNISNNPKMIYLYCNKNQITNLNTSNNPELTILKAENNLLTDLSLSNNLKLTQLWAHSNQLTSLNVSNNSQLVELYCFNNQLSSLNISNNIALSQLSCRLNRLTSLDASNNIALTYLECQDNNLTGLNVINSPLLESLYCNGNLLASLDVSSNPVLKYFNCVNNPLTCIKVHQTQLDDIPVSWSKGLGTTYSLVCGGD